MYVSQEITIEEDSQKVKKIILLFIKAEKWQQSFNLSKRATSPDFYPAIFHFSIH